MGQDNATKRTVRSDADLARMAIRVAQVAQADAIICVTETGNWVEYFKNLPDRIRVIVATMNGPTCEDLTRAGWETIRLPLRAADKYGQIRHVISVALRSARVSAGELVVCVLGRNVYPEGGILIVLAEIESAGEPLAISDLLKLTDGIRPSVLEAAVAVACKIGRAARRGKRLGAIFTLGDSLKVLEGSRQLVPNPFQGHPDAVRRLTNPDIHEALIELSKLDGAFVVRGDGFIQTAGVFLTSTQVEVELPSGLGARHAAAAAVTKRTAATAIVVSATDGNVRAFSGGRLVLQIDPDMAHNLVIFDRQDKA